MTGRQQLFALSYARHGVGTIAAQEAGYADPTQDGWRQLAKPDVQAEIVRRRQQIADKLDKKAELALDGMTSAKFERADLDTLSKVAGRSVQTAMLLRGEPTSITASVNVELSAELLGQLAGEFGLDPDRLAGDLAVIDLSPDNTGSYSAEPVKSDRDWS